MYNEKVIQYARITDEKLEYNPKEAIRIRLKRHDGLKTNSILMYVKLDLGNGICINDS